MQRGASSHAPTRSRRGHGAMDPRHASETRSTPACLPRQPRAALCPCQRASTAAGIGSGVQRVPDTRQCDAPARPPREPPMTETAVPPSAEIPLLNPHDEPTPLGAHAGNIVVLQTRPLLRVPAVPAMVDRARPSEHATGDALHIGRIGSRLLDPRGTGQLRSRDAYRATPATDAATRGRPTGLSRHCGDRSQARLWQRAHHGTAAACNPCRVRVMSRGCRRQDGSSATVRRCGASARRDRTWPGGRRCA